MFLASSHIPFSVLQPLTPLSPLFFPFPDGHLRGFALEPQPLQQCWSPAPSSGISAAGNAQGKGWEHREPGLGYSSRPGLISQLHSALKSTVYSTKCGAQSKIAAGTTWPPYQKFSTPVDLQNTTMGFLSCLHQTKVNAHQQLGINTERASPA